MHRHEREAKDRRLVTHWNPENRGYSKGRNTSGEADTTSRSPRVEGSQSHSCVMEITCWIIICTLLSQPDDQQTAQWMIRVYTIISLSTLNCALFKYDLFSMTLIIGLVRWWKIKTHGVRCSRLEIFYYWFLCNSSYMNSSSHINTQYSQSCVCM